MSRKRDGSHSSNLFPFLAVLISAMGALILLLLVVAQKAGKDRDQEYAAKREELIAKAADLPALPEKKKFPAIGNPPDLVVPELIKHDLKPLPEVVDRRSEIQRRIAEVRHELKAQTETVNPTDAPEKNRRLAELSAAIQSLEAQLVNIQKAKEAAAEKAAKLQSDYAALDARRKEAERKARSASERYSIVPYFGPNGTNREPLYIECRGNRITLQPEGIELQPSDLPDANDPENILAKMMRVLMTHERSNGKRPYPLIIVRPDGVATFYIARGAMSFLETDYGYELVPDSVTLDFGEFDEKAQQLAQKVVDDDRKHPRPTRPSNNRAFVLDDRPPSSQGAGNGGGAGSGQGAGMSGGGRRGTASRQPIPERSREELERIADSLPSMPSTAGGGPGPGFSANSGRGTGARGPSAGAENEVVAGGGQSPGGGYGEPPNVGNGPDTGSWSGRGQGNGAGTGDGDSLTPGQGNGRGGDGFADGSGRRGGTGFAGSGSGQGSGQPGLPEGMPGDSTDVASLANQGTPLLPPTGNGTGGGLGPSGGRGGAGGFGSSVGGEPSDSTGQGNGLGNVPGGRGSMNGTPGAGEDGSQGEAPLLSAANNQQGTGRGFGAPNGAQSGEPGSSSLEGDAGEETSLTPEADESESGQPLLSRSSLPEEKNSSAQQRRGAAGGPRQSNNAMTRGTASRGGNGGPASNGQEYDELTAQPAGPSMASVDQPLRAGQNAPQQPGQRLAPGSRQNGQRPQGTPSAQGSPNGQGVAGQQGYAAASANGKANQSQAAGGSSSPGPKTQPTEFEQALAEMSGTSGGGSSAGPGSMSIPLPGMGSPSTGQTSDDDIAAPRGKQKSGEPMIQPQIGPTGRIRATVRKMVTIECRRTGITLYPGGKFIPYDGDPSMKSLKKEIYKHVADQMMTWGSASEIHRWAPVLEMNVRPDGLERYYDLRFAMIGSGIEMRERLLSWKDDLDFPEFFGAGKQADSARKNSDGTIRR